MSNKNTTSEIYDPHLKVSKYQWGEKEGVLKMKSMTPGENGRKSKKMAEQKVPYLFMTSDQKRKLNEEKMQLEFDGVQTKNLDICPGAYAAFKDNIETLRSGNLLGEPVGHDMPSSTPTSKTPVAKRMQFKQYLDV